MMGDWLLLGTVGVRVIPLVEASVSACLLTCPMVSVRSSSVITCFRGFPCDVLVGVSALVATEVANAITVGPAPRVLVPTVPDWMVGVTLFVLVASPQAASKVSITSTPHTFKISIVLFRENKYTPLP